jgi:hypothetical protein
MVRLGRDTPSWELNRWGRDTLRFSPLEGDRFSLRGNKRYLEYKGTRESHRFTILDNEKFEYDIILNREPEGNKLYLNIEGWENFDFFRQPDLTGPEALRGSYAVYKKEAVINSPIYHVGTGKLCHIHRPKIIDARGREVWGDVIIEWGKMTITIPEGWLGEAKYPVIVDPIIGCNTLGAYSTYKYLPYSWYNYWYEDVVIRGEEDYYSEDRELEFDMRMALNKFKTPVLMEGTYNTYIYINKTTNSSWGVDGVYAPFMYTDNNNKPKKLINTGINSQYAKVYSTYPPKWFGEVINIGRIEANTDVWFGFFVDCSAYLRFDYGSQYYMPFIEASLFPEDVAYYYDTYDNPFLEFITDMGLDDLSYTRDSLNDPTDDYRNVYPGQRMDFKISMYLQIIQQSFTRTLTQGVKLIDRINRIQRILKKLTESIKVNQGIGRVFNTIRKAIDTAAVRGEVIRKNGMFRRNINDNGLMNTENRNKAQYKRELEDNPGVEGETNRIIGYVRKQEDTMTVLGEVIRMLGIFIRLVSGSMIRDYITGRFLKAREEVVLKSAVCREIVLNSRIH